MQVIPRSGVQHVPEPVHRAPISKVHLYKVKFNSILPSSVEIFFPHVFLPIPVTYWVHCTVFSISLGDLDIKSPSLCFILNCSFLSLKELQFLLFHRVRDRDVHQYKTRRKLLICWGVIWYLNKSDEHVDYKDG